MNAHSENETWVVERGGEVIEKKAQSGVSSLSTWERLVYCLCVAEYGMRNAGDFKTAQDIYPDFQADGKRSAEQLSLSATCEAFSLSEQNLQREYFERFRTICNEIKNAEPGTAPSDGAATPVDNLGVMEELPSVS